MDGAWRGMEEMGMGDVLTLTGAEREAGWEETTSETIDRGGRGTEGRELPAGMGGTTVDGGAAAGGTG